MHRAAQPVIFDEKNITEWLESYHNGLITEADKKLLDVIDVLHILKVEMSNEKLADDFLSCCNKKSHPKHKNLESFTIGVDLYYLIKDNILNNNISTSKFILKKLAEDFGIGLSLQKIIDLNNVEIAEFIQENLGHFPYYADLPQAIKTILVNNKPEILLKEAIEQGNTAQVKKLLDTPDFKPDMTLGGPPTHGYTAAHLAGQIWES